MMPFHTIATRRLTALAAGLTVTLTGASCQPLVPSTTDESTITLTVRLWDDAVADAYDSSFQQFTEETGIAVQVIRVPWVEYWSQLRSDIAAGTVDDLFWVNAGNFRDYADAGVIIPWLTEADDNAAADFSNSATQLYSHEGFLWGVPQIVDPGVAIFVNCDIVDSAGVAFSALERLWFDPDANSDTLRTIATALTRDTSGNAPDNPAFDNQRIAHYGYSASNNLGAILLPMIGSNGGAWQDGDRFVFDSPAATEAIAYTVSLVNDYQVAPPASDTNPPAGNETAKDLFLSGKLALFQSGPYHLVPIHELASFPWRIVPLPTGPAGNVSPTNAIILAASASSPHPEQQQELIDWAAGKQHAEIIGNTGAAMPALLDGQDSYLDYWSTQGVDISPMLEVLSRGYIQTPQGPNYSAAQQAYEPLLNSVFLGTREPVSGITQAVSDSNTAMATRE